MTDIDFGCGRSIIDLIRSTRKIRKIKDVTFIPELYENYVRKFTNPFFRIYAPDELCLGGVMYCGIEIDEGSAERKGLVSIPILVATQGIPIFSDVRQQHLYRIYDLSYLFDNFLEQGLAYDSTFKRQVQGQDDSSSGFRPNR